MTAAYRIPLNPVGSTHIGAIGYDAARRVLAVQFASTATVFHYGDVPLEVALAFEASDSKGRFYTSQIRGRFPGQRMTGPCAACGLEDYAGERCRDCGAGVCAVPARKEAS